MNENPKLPSKKQTICIILLALLFTLACNYPDAYKMVYDNFFGRENTREARERNLRGTENAIMSTRIAEQNTLHAEENNREMTADAIQQTQNAVVSTQTEISFQQTWAAKEREYNEKSTAYASAKTSEAKTLEVTPRNPVIDAVRFPATFKTGEQVTGWIDFHDYNGDVNRVRIDAVRATSWSTMEFYPSIVKGDNNRGTIEFSFI